MTTTESGEKVTSGLRGSPVASYYLLIAATSILVLIGLASVLSSSSIASIQKEGGNAWSLFIIQLVALAAGALAAVIGSRFAVVGWKRITPVVLYGSVAALVVVLTSGIAYGGNKNWIFIGKVSFQPSEMAKLALALYLGLVLSRFRKQLVTAKALLFPGGAAIVIIGLVLAGGDMGTAIVMVLLVVAAYWVAGAPLRYFVIAGIGLALAAAALVKDADSRSTRIDVWLNPDTCDPTAECAQTTHALYALASGGLWGLGPGMSREKWGYLPVSDSDFIFAIIGEEWGLIGTLIVVIAFAVILVAVTRIIRRHEDPFVQITSAALGAWIVGQAVINIAVVLRLLPVTGVPLPLVSSGGSSLVMTLAAIGVLLAFARSEPGAREAFAARPSVIRKYLTVLAGRRA